MHFTDLFIRKPVLSAVISLLILVLGLRSVSLLPIREYPYIESAVVTVATSYVGADPELIAGFITTPLEHSIAEANGIDYLSSTSAQGVSTITASLRLNYDSNRALTEINTKVNAVINQLPKEAQQPVISVTVGDPTDSMYIGFYSDILPSSQVTDYLIRAVQPKLQAVSGVQQAVILGGRQFAMRAWLEPGKLASYGLTSSDVANALAENNFISAVGRTDGDMITMNLLASTGLHTVDEFRNLIVKAKNGALVRLKDVANVTLGAEDYNTVSSFDGKEAVYIGIKITPGSNLLEVIENVRKVFPGIETQLPEGLHGKIVYDVTKFVEGSIRDVEQSIAEAFIIVTCVVFIFLGTLRSVCIPVIAIPLSLIGVFFIMFLLGYTINLLTLLALVFAVGLVVDDAIIVVENVHRHMEEGLSPLKAALLGTRELALPIIAISIVLIAVYLPIGFMGGLTGILFTEFAFTLSGAVAISAVIALTLSPMMCSKLMKKEEVNDTKGRFSHFVDTQFETLKKQYQASLHTTLNYLPVILVFGLIILVSLYFLYSTSKKELAPTEDQGVILASLTAAPNANLSQTELYSKQVYKIFSTYPEMDHVFQVNGANGLNTALAGMVLKPWGERRRTASEIQSLLQQGLSKVAGAKIVVFQRPPLPGSGGGLPIQFVIETPEPYENLYAVLLNVVDLAQKSGFFIYLDWDLKFDKSQIAIEIDRDKAAQLGLNMQDVGNMLAYALGGNYVNFFNLQGRSYKVIPQVMRSDRLNYDQLLNYYLTEANGKSIALSTIASLKTEVVPQSLPHFQQLNAATISAIMLPGLTLEEGLIKLQKFAKDILPTGYSIDYKGESRQYMQEKSALIGTFFFALIIIFLSLAALFESFRDPLIILVSVPMSIFGAMIFINLGVGGASLNIYTEVGLVTLIGLISKHGILIVQFANDLQRQGKNKRDAIEMAASIRLRPILMTTAAMVLGVIPLIMATGAGAASRFNIGLVIASGISIGTLFTLFVLPGLYLYLAHDLAK